MIRLAVAITFLSGSAVAETVFATTSIRPNTIIGPENIGVRDVAIAGTIADPLNVVGMEARVAIYAGRPIRLGDVGPPSIVLRNETVTLQFRRHGLEISAEGRALDRGAVGETVRVMNLASRQTLTGKVLSNGHVEVY